MPNAHDSNGSTDAGRCPSHPLVQLRRRSQRTGAWRSLLDSCPLCAADDREPGASFAPAPTSPKSPAIRRLGRGRSASGVYFPAARQLVRRRSISAPSAPTAISAAGPQENPKAAPKALKEPKYKECKIEMQRQLDESQKEGVTFMSDDLDLGLSLSMNMTEIWNSEESEDAGKRSHVDLARMTEKKLWDSWPTPEDSKAEELSDGSGRSGGSRPPDGMARVLQLELCQNSSSRGDDTQRSPSPDSSPDASRSCGNSRNRQPPGVAAPAQPQRWLRPVRMADEVPTLSCADDSATANSVAMACSSNNSNALGCLYNQEYDERGQREEDEDKNKEAKTTNPAATAINTTNYDSKGRCVRHLHVCLRTKKLLGKGWTILLSACPECCMDELRRIHAVDLKKSIHMLDEKEEEMVKTTGKHLPKNKKKRTKTKKKLARHTKDQEGLDRLHHHSKDGITGDGDAGPSTSGIVGSARVGITHGISDPRCRSPRVASTQPRSAHPRRAPSQEGSWAAAPKSHNQQAPSRDGPRSAADPCRSPPLNSFNKGSVSGGTGSHTRLLMPPLQRKTQQTTCVDHSVGDHGCRSPRLALVPARPAPPDRLRRRLPQEGYLAVPVPPRTAVTRLQNQGTPSQDSSLSAPGPRSSPPKNSFCKGGIGVGTRSTARHSLPLPLPKKASPTKEVPDYVRNPGRKSLLSALVPLRPTQSVHPHRPLLQGGSRSQNQWLPPQDDSRMSPNPRKLSPQDSFCKGVSAVGTSSNLRRQPAAPRKAKQTTVVTHGICDAAHCGGDPRHRFPRSTPGPAQSAHPVRPCRVLTQEGSWAMTVPSRAAVLISQNQPPPSQDGPRSTRNLRGSPPQDIFCKAITGSYTSSNAQRSRPSPGKAQQTTPSDRSASTASLTESEQLSSSDRSHAMPVVVKH